MGKSHLIHFAALILVNWKPESTVYITYSHQGLMEKGNTLLNNIKSVTEKHKRIKPILPGSRIVPKEKDIILVDECDEVYTSNLKWFETFMVSATVLAFTATPPLMEDELES